MLCLVFHGEIKAAIIVEKKYNAGYFVVYFVYSHTSNFLAIWRLSPLLVTGLQI
jgi:hypothetical protein